jgi:hypothetical protein
MSKNKTLNIIPDKKQLGKYYLILALVVALVFGNTLFNGYNMDDHLVTQNHVYTSKGISGIKDILTSNYYSNNADINFGYRPIVHISFAIEHQFLGEHAFISHFINLVLYLLTILLLFKLCLKWFGEKKINAALLTSLIFAVHPIHTEAIASIKNRDELLALLLGLFAVYNAMKYINTNKLMWLIIAVIAFALGMLAKKSIYPILVVVPIILITLQQVSVRKILLTVVMISIPSAFIGSDLNILKGFFLLSLPLMSLLVSFTLVNYSVFTKQVKQIYTRLPFKMASQILAIMAFILGLWLKEMVFVVGAILLTTKKINARGILILSIQFTIVGYVFGSNIFNKYGLILAIAYIMQNALPINNKNINYALLIVALIPVVYFIFIQKDPLSYLLISEMIVFFILTERKAIFGLLFILVSTAVSIIVFNSYALNYILIAYAAFKTFKEYKSQHELEINSLFNSVIITSVILILMLVSRPIHSDYFEKIKQQFHRFNTEYLNTKYEKNNGVKEGRRINYIENTLTDKYTRAELLATGFSTIAEYGRLTLFPSELSFYYGYAKIKTVNFSDKNAWLGLITLLVSVAIALWYFKRSILISIGIVWYILSIALFSNWFEPVAGMVGERLAYTASVGFCLAFAAFVLWLKPNFSLLKPKGLELVVIVFLGLLSFRSISRNHDWADPITLMEHDIEHLENSAQAHNLLALNLMYVSSNNKNINPQQVIEMQNKAAVHLQKSTEIYPYFFNTNFDLARIYINLGDLIKARESLDQALKIDPNNLFALEEMAKTCYELKLVDDTERYANKYLAQIPQNENMHEILIYNMLANGRLESAIYYAERAMSYYPNNQIIQKMYKDAQNMLGASKPKNQ